MLTFHDIVSACADTPFVEIPQSWWKRSAPVHIRSVEIIDEVITSRKALPDVLPLAAGQKNAQVLSHR